MATYLRIGAVGASSDDIQIGGDVTERVHAGWIEVKSFAFGSKPGTDPENGGSGDEGDTGGVFPSASERVRANGLTFSKWTGKDSPMIFDWALSGQPYDLQFDACRENGEPFMRVFVYEARVQSFSQSAEENEEPTEDLKVLFDRIAFESTGFARDESRLAPTRVSTSSDRGNVAARASVGVLAAQVSESQPKSGSGQRVTDRLAAKAVSEGELPEFVQEDRVLTIAKINQIPFELGSFAGTEELSKPFEFWLDITSTELDVRPEKVIGQPVAFKIEDHEDIEGERKADPRFFHGHVAEIHAGQVATDHRDYTIRVVPWFWFLNQRTDCRIFQKKNVLEIVSEVFQGLGFTDFDKSNARGQYDKYEYCVQYRESDFDFVSRLLEENGIFYYFEFAENSHKMILADSSVAHRNCGNAAVVQSTGSGSERHVRNWTSRMAHVSGAVRVRDYNHETPSDSLEVIEKVASSVVKVPDLAKFELYDYPGRYPNVAGGKSRAKVRIEVEESSHIVVSGDGNCDGFAAGTKFKLTAHESSAEVGNEYVLTTVAHAVHRMPGYDLKPRLHYRNDFECIPKRVTFRPPVETVKPRIHGPQTAVVVGKSGEEIDPDKYGAVKVQFHWDRLGKKDENSSCFVRVAQPIAGKSWGGLWLPRIGQEVVVEFLEGDPDRPLITGSVYNAENMPPYGLPANKTVNTYKSRSTKSGKAENFNELRFEDLKGSEQIYLHAERDFDRVVEQHDTLKVGGKEAQKGNQTIEIEENRAVTVNFGDETYTIKKGDRIIKVETGDQSLTVAADRSSDIGGKDTLTVGSDRKCDVGGSETTNVGNGRTVKVQSGNQLLKVSSGKATIDAMQAIELKCGANSIKIDASGITIKGMMIKVQGQTQVQIQGLITDIKGTAMLKAGGGITMLG